MKHNNSKIEMIEDINKIMGLLITVRTVETSPLDSNHWTNSYINSLSEIKYQAMADEDECSACAGDGVQYPAYAESQYDAEPCEECYSFGFSSRKKIALLFNEIEKVAIANKNSSLYGYIESIKEKPLYR